MKINIELSEPTAFNEFAHCKLFFDDQGSVYSSFVDIGNYEQVYSLTQDLSSNAFDFYFLGVIVYEIDKLVRRKKYSLDGWTRELEFDYPVHNPEVWEPIKEVLENTLSFLTGDNWTIKFIKTAITEYYKPKRRFNPSSFRPDKVNLYSGGLDSLIGAIDYLKENETDKVLLVSQYDMSGPRSDQEKLYKNLVKQFHSDRTHWISQRVRLKAGAEKKISRETTFRSRSLLFISIASLLAHNLTPGKAVYIPENGTISLNIPLSPSRRSSCSTKTTHPYLLNNINKVFQALDINTTISNPYEYKTKGEMMADCKDLSFLKNIVEESCSCGKRSHKAHWTNKKASHCGVCMPCIYRRAALNKVNIDSSLQYGNDLFSDLNFNQKRKMINDLKTLFRFISRDLSKEQIKRELIINGSYDFSQLDDYADIVYRTIDEIKVWINNNSGSPNYSIIKQMANL